MNEHRLNPQTNVCLGCGRLATEIAEQKASPPCAAVYGNLGNKTQFAITPDEALIVWPGGFGGGFVVRFTRAEMFNLRDGIDDGIERLRRAGSSRVLEASR